MTTDNVIQMPDNAARVERLYVKAVAAIARGIDAYMEFAQTCVELADAGETQDTIAVKTKVSRSYVARALAVARDARIVRIANNSLPRDSHALYLLTTLDDASFSVMAKPETSRALLEDFIATHQPTREAAPSNEPRKPGRPKGRKPQAQGYVSRLSDAGIIDPRTNARQRRTLKEELRQTAGLQHTRAMTPEEDAKLAAATVVMKVRHGVASADKVIEQERGRAALSTNMTQRYDRAVSHAREAMRTDLQRQFRDAVAAEVRRQMPEEIQRAQEAAREAMRRAQRMVDEFTARRNAIPKAMTREEWRLVLNCLHPDRAPADRRERFAEAFAVVRKLEAYLDTFDK